MLERLGHYRILERIGAGGMGEVYRASDTRLGRDVAVKVLPAHFSDSLEVRQRFEREARALASFSHPNICALYDVGRENGIDFLVMEYLEGETLASRLRRGAVPPDQALRIAAEVAAALDAAHRRGIVHRDLKPGNVMITKNAAKLLDFGLAKEPASLIQGGHSSAPTRSEPLTAAGAILGTLDYMAPEQLEGKEADARSDIFSFGAIVYEMLTGRPAFSGASQAGLISAILTAEPARISELQPMTPPALERAVGRCLAKDPEERWQSARDVMFEMKGIASRKTDSPGAAAATPRRGERIIWVAAILALCVGLGFAMLALARQPEVLSRPAHFSIALPDHAVSLFTRVSPDGTTISQTAKNGDQTRLWIRPLDALSARPLEGTEGARAHFWSPDSRFIAFFAGGKLKKIDVNDGSVTDVCDAPGAGPFQLGAWGRDGTILLRVDEAPDHEEGLFRVSSSGGKVERLDIRDGSGNKIQVGWPGFLPDSRHFIGPCLLKPGLDDSRATCLVSLESLQASVLLEAASYALPAPPGYLLFVQGSTLFAQHFDFETLRLSGTPSPVAERMEQWAGIGAPKFSVSENGVLAYQMAGGEADLIWRDRRGAEIGQVGSPASYDSIRLSPDGNRLVAGIVNQRGVRDLWTIDVNRGVPTRVDSDGLDSYAPMWSPDGKKIVYCKAIHAPPFLHARTLAGGEDEVLLPSTGTMQCPTGISSDGRYLLFEDRNPTTGWDVWLLPLGTDPPRATPLIRTPQSETDASFSPDGGWIAYTSDETGRPEVYAQPFQHPGERLRISTSGGSTPRWRRDGKELFYLSADGHLMAVSVTPGKELTPAAPLALFLVGQGSAEGPGYEVSRDGERFLVGSPVPGSQDAAVMVNWMGRLRKN
ncbi:MAG TPA: protein kinase [Candidatus Polarisedimenticolia bacterium]|nr:protein kinase [Candidatus Polarisedimenticolia bacterium]